MSVDYRSCSCCWDTRYEEAVTSCEKCGENICLNCVEGVDHLPPAQYFFKDWCQNDDGELLSIHCPHCIKKAIEDANPHKDFLGNALNIGDNVVAIWGRTSRTYLYKWVIKTLSPIRATVTSPSGKNTSIDKDLLIKI